MLRVGDPCPPWSGTTARGEAISGAAFLGRPLVLFFYPKAGTTGCTIETRSFAEHYAEFVRAGVAVVGVSVDTVEVQRQFASDCRAEFPLVADADKSIARGFGVVGLLGLARRVTFWVGEDGRIEEVVQGMLPGPHLRRARARLGAGGGGSLPPPVPTAPPMNEGPESSKPEPP